MDSTSDHTPVVVVPYDLAWPSVFDALATEIRDLLGDGARELVHVGSTAVPGLSAKPVIDIVLTVDDSSAESTYLAPLIRAGFRLVVREPDWYEHRMLKRDAPSVNLHVFSAGCEEVDRMVQFRDWLRVHDDDRELYASTKRQLASRTWERVQDYADAKTEVVTQILDRADSAT